MCITEFAVQILAQHCKSTIIQQLKKKKSWNLYRTLCNTIKHPPFYLAIAILSFVIKTF